MAEGARIEVQVVPRASANRVGPMKDGVLHVRVTRPPADGEANRAVQGLLAAALRLAPGRVSLIRGERARRKLFAVAGLGQSEVDRRLAERVD